VLLQKDPKGRFQTPSELLNAMPMIRSELETRGQPTKEQKLQPSFVQKFTSRQAELPPPRAPQHSIAVLPFESLSDNKRDTYFADGVQDEIISNLAKVSQLKVISRTSVMAYRSQGKRDLRSIAKALRVANVVEGTVRRDRNRVRITTQLVDARTDETLWSESYDRDLTDIFAVQSEIAQAVASKLSAHLSRKRRRGSKQSRPTALRPTTSISEPMSYS
jgi:TolB-like protein